MGKKEKILHQMTDDPNTQPFFLLPKGEEDPLKLRPFLKHHVPGLAPLYEEIQKAKASADTENLLLIKESFEILSKPLSQCKGEGQDLVEYLKKEVKGDPVDLWPEQTPQQCIGSILFYPQEMIPCGNSGILSYPGLAASLAISGYYGNPVAIHQLSTGYSNIIRQSRKMPYDWKEEMERRPQEENQSHILKKEAIRLFNQAQANKVAQLYLACEAYYYRECKISDEEFIKLLQSIDHPKAFFELGRIYENKKDISKENEKRAYAYYRKALDKGYEDASYGVHRLYNKKEDDLPRKILYEKGKGKGLYLSAQRSLQKGKKEQAKTLFELSGQLGHLWSYHQLAETILLYKIISKDPEKDAVFYYQKIDRPGYAEGSRLIEGSPRLCPSPSQKKEILERMVDLKDIEGYENLLICWNIKRYHPEIQKIFTTRDDIQGKFQNLLQEREKILKLVNDIGQNYD